MATTNKKINFSYFERKQDFTSALQTELTNNIVFVEDTKEVYTHGTFFGVRAVTLNYDSATARIQLKDGDAVISEVDATPFIKDGMLDSVELITTPESGGASSLIVEGDNISGVLPIVTLDADTFEYDSNAGKYLIPVANQQNKAFAISNCEGKEFYFNGRPATDGNIAAVKLDAVSSIGYIDDIPSETVNQWVAFPDWSVENFGGDYYGFENNYDWDNGFHEGYTVTESSGSNYPTLPYLKFTFNTVKTTASGSATPSHEVIRVSVKDLIDTYDGANVNLSSTYAKAVSYADPAINDSVDTAVGKLTKGLNDAQAQLLWNEYAGA